MPRSGACGAIGTRATQRCGWTVLTAMHADSATLYAIDRNGYGTVIIQQRARLTQFGVVERLRKIEKK